MKRLLLILLCLGMIGCATVVRHESISYSDNGSTTGIVISCSRNIGQEGVIGHLIKIDYENQIQVDANSEITVYLDPGSHQVEFISFSSIAKSTYHPYGAYSASNDKIIQFGKPVKKDIYIEANEIKSIKYIAPFLIMQQGSVSILNR